MRGTGRLRSSAVFTSANDVPHAQHLGDVLELREPGLHPEGRAGGGQLERGDGLPEGGGPGVEGGDRRRLQQVGAQVALHDAHLGHASWRSGWRWRSVTTRSPCAARRYSSFMCRSGGPSGCRRCGVRRCWSRCARFLYVVGLVDEEVVDAGLPRSVSPGSCGLVEELLVASPRAASTRRLEPLDASVASVAARPASSAARELGRPAGRGRRARASCETGIRLERGLGHDDRVPVVRRRRGRRTARRLSPVRSSLDGGEDPRPAGTAAATRG